VIRGMASCVTSALWPERVTGLVSYAGYDIIGVERFGHAFAAAVEHEQWYQHLFQLERGRECLAQYRRELCRVRWEQWSPSGKFDDSTFGRTASSFDNPDFVDVVIHCYRFCFGTAAGDPALASLDARLAAKPKIGIPTITLDGTQDPLKPSGTANHAPMFINRHEHRVVDCGHNLQWEAPYDFADAILTVRG
jgi:pimeloyl-ACP methyl ester carboxylesterase